MDKETVLRAIGVAISATIVVMFIVWLRYINDPIFTFGSIFGCTLVFTIIFYKFTFKGLKYKYSRVIPKALKVAALTTLLMLGYSIFITLVMMSVFFMQWLMVIWLFLAATFSSIWFFRIKEK